MADPMNDTKEVSYKDLMREVEAVLIRRVEEVERENASLKRRSIVLGAAAGLVLIVSLVSLAVAFSGGAAGRAGVIEAQRFVLRAEDGSVRGAMELTDNGAARLVFRDRDGRERMKITMLADGSPGVTLADRDGRPRAVLGVLPDQTSTLVFADASGKTRAVLGLGSDGSSTMVFADRQGATRVGLGVNEAGAAGLTLYEQEQGAAAPVLEALPDPSAEEQTPQTEEEGGASGRGPLPDRRIEMGGPSGRPFCVTAPPPAWQTGNAPRLGPPVASAAAIPPRRWQAAPERRATSWAVQRSRRRNPAAIPRKPAARPSRCSRSA